MNCERVMQREVYCARPRDSAQHAAMLMRRENLGFLPVCDDEGCVIGTLTDRDLALRVCARGADAARLAVAEVMSHELVACRPDDDLAHAERLMAQHQKSRILITDEHAHLIGVVSVADVVRHDSNRHAAHTLRQILQREYRL
jgi:CBS domain-containing protein